MERYESSRIGNRLLIQQECRNTVDINSIIESYEGTYKNFMYNSAKKEILKLGDMIRNNIVYKIYF